MATPNYGYEKRQKELAKKRKKEDKLKNKSERRVGSDEDGAAPAEDTLSDAETSGVQTPTDPA
ncbi:MAG: hypothetical protein K9J50_06765 [Sulfuritalea sp.]|nr:hypothetical protein [Sulfuritalea sp.]